MTVFALVILCPPPPPSFLIYRQVEDAIRAPTRCHIEIIQGSLRQDTIHTHPLTDVGYQDTSLATKKHVVWMKISGKLTQEVEKIPFCEFIMPLDIDVIEFVLQI